MKRLFVLFLLLFFVFTLWVGHDRYVLKQRINQLEYQQDGLILARDLAQYRAKFPLKENK